jgi:hypothetical protein|nr:MAG TPA: Head fiber protein [Crassvirales sp.]
MIVYNTKEQAKMKLRGMSIPFGSSILLDTLEGQILGVQGHEEINFLSMDSLPPTGGKVDQILKLDKNGNVVWADDEMRAIIDNLDSTSTDAALSANMGRELNEIKINKSIFNSKVFLVGADIVVNNKALRINHSTSTYSSAEDKWINSTIYSNFPEASADSNGLLSILKWKMLDYAEQYFNTNTVGFVTAMRDFTYTADQVNLSKKVFYRNNDTWTQTDSPIKITAATQSQAGVMSAADKTKLDNTVSATTEATPDTLGLVKQAAELTDLQADNDLAGVIAHFNQLLANLKEAGIMYATPVGS